MPPLCVFPILPVSPLLCHRITIVRRRPSVCTPALELYYISITLYFCCGPPLSPQRAPRFHWDPTGQTIAQQGAFTPICHRLSPFVLPHPTPTNKMLPFPAPRTLSHLVTVTHGISCFSVSHGSLFSGIPFFYCKYCMTQRTNARNSFLPSNYRVSYDINIVACYRCIIDGLFVSAYGMLIKR